MLGGRPRADGDAEGACSRGWLAIRCGSARVMVGGELERAVEQQPAAAGTAAVEAERELAAPSRSRAAMSAGPGVRRAGRRVRRGVPVHGDTEASRGIEGGDGRRAADRLDAVQPARSGPQREVPQPCRRPGQAPDPG